MLSKNQLGFFYMFISVCAFSLMDVIVKWSDDYPVGQVLFFRGFCGIIPILFLIPKDRYLDFNKKIENIVINIGAAKDILTTVAKGKFLNAINMDTSAINPAKHLLK